MGSRAPGGLPLAHLLAGMVKLLPRAGPTSALAPIAPAPTMSIAMITELSTFPAVGRVLEIRDDILVFNPLNTNYELHLRHGNRRWSGPVKQRTQILIRAKGRKIWTVPSGGNFLTPIFGPPRIAQGRIKHLDEKLMVVQAATPIIIELPADDAAYSLATGVLSPGTLINATLLPGATYEPL